jgi:hypothetical protein
VGGPRNGESISKKEHPNRDLSTSLRFGRDDKGESGDLTGHHLLIERTAGPSTTLRSGRDDNSLARKSLRREMLTLCTKVVIAFGFYPRTNRRVPHIPDFLCSFVGSLNFMRLSLKRAAHAVLSGAAYRKFGASRSSFARCGIPQLCPSSLPRGPQLCRGAPCSHQRTWAENDGRSPSTAFSSGPSALFAIWNNRCAYSTIRA